MSVISFLLLVVSLAANWRVYQKMGRQGWEGIIPFYNIYVQFEVLYGQGAKMFLLLIPFYGIYIAIKAAILRTHSTKAQVSVGDWCC